MDEIEGTLGPSVYDNYPLTKKQIEELLGFLKEKPEIKNESEKKKVDTDQEDVPLDVLKNFRDPKPPHGCPRCGQNGMREQIKIVDTNEPLRFRCCSCGGVSLSADWG